MDLNFPPKKPRRTDDAEMGQSPPTPPPDQDQDMQDTPPDEEPPAVEQTPASDAEPILRQYLSMNRRILRHMDEVRPADEESKRKQMEIRSTLIGFNNGLQVAIDAYKRAEGHLNARQKDSTPSTPVVMIPTISTTDQGEWTPAPSRRRSNRNPNSSDKLPPPPRTSSQPPRQLPAYKQALLTNKRDALKKLADLKPKPEASRQVIYEPVDPTKRREHISNLCFIREFASAISETGIKNPIEALYRLPRGGFRIQLVPAALKWLIEREMPSIRMLQYGEWIHWKPKPTRRSVIMEPIAEDITLEDLKYELIEPSAKIALTEADVTNSIHGMERMKYKDRSTGQLKNSRKVRVYVDDDLLAKLVASGGFLLGYQSVHVREYNLPKFRCFNCNQIGTHRAGECRQPRRSPLDWADQMETENPETSRKRQNE